MWEGPREQRKGPPCPLTSRQGPGEPWATAQHGRRPLGAEDRGPALGYISYLAA